MASQEEQRKFNTQLFVDEMAKANSIMRRNRHNSLNGKWYGPDPEPRPSGPDCGCLGCIVGGKLRAEPS